MADRESAGAGGKAAQAVVSSIGLLRHSRADIHGNASRNNSYTRLIFHRSVV